MGNLKEDTNAITCFAFCIFSGTMIQILYNPQCVGNCIMGFFAFDIDNCSDTAVIMFKFLTVKFPAFPFITSFIFLYPFLIVDLRVSSLFTLSTAAWDKSTEQRVSMVRS